jgi:MFS family permease
MGFLIGAGLAGASLATLLVGLRGDAWGRRRVLVVLTLGTAMGYAALAAVSDAFLLAPFAFAGMLNGMGRDRGAAAALEQAILPATVRDGERTWALAWYNVVLDAGHALGALAATLPTVVSQGLSVGSVRAHQVTFLMCAAALAACTPAYLALTPGIEVASRENHARRRVPLDPRSRRVITRLALLFGLDSAGGGFLNTALVAYWFFRQYGTPEAVIAMLFFAARGLNALSHLGAAWLARRIGLVNTMVWTHLPSSLFLMAAPAAPGAAGAAALFLAREALVEMDVPTRQSYVMAVVQPAERTFASSVTHVTRNVAWVVGPSVSGLLMQHVALAAPLFIGGALKICYDLLLYSAFRNVRPPEEVAAAARAVSE